jgi:quercetin dioxygenase-like cupin family protein
VRSVKFPEELRKPAFEVASDIEGLRGYMFQAPDGSQVVLWECDANQEVKPHKHDFDEYCLVVEGSCEEVVEGRATILEKGDEMVIPAGKTHWATIRAGYRAIDFFGGHRLDYKRPRG